MRLIDAARARLRLLFARRAAESRMNEEIRFHVEMEAGRIAREQGLAPDEARRRALVAFGGVERYKEELREGRGLAWLGGMRLDLKLGLRMMAKSPGLTLVGVVGMAVAIAIGAVTFGIIHNFIGVTLPLDDGDRLVAIQNVDARRNVEGDGTHLHDLAVWRGALGAVEALGAYRTVARNVISRDARPDPMRVVEMTASGFRIARVQPLLGRYFDDAEERPGAPPVVVIGYDVWQHRFAGEPDVVGRTIQLGATAHTIVGVMPRGFAFPVNNRVWTPLRLDPAAFTPGDAPPVQVFGRLAPGASLDDAQAQLTTIGKRLAADHPESHEHVRPRVLPYASAFFDSPELTWALYVVQAMVSMILVVIGTNVATLVYARTASRMGEIAVRTALGASRRRIVAQLFMEALVLSAAAAAVGL
ncbi:MAG TPA: ABC transporter permease, partial [Gemmatimonadaceae bacterium]|nr:ABC transporter permease [Gemmatimonadaceae bacterium]